MPDVSKLEQNQVPIEEIRTKLDELQSYEAVGKLYEVSGRTVRRYIEGKLERRFCWHPIVTITPKSAQPTTGE